MIRAILACDNEWGIGKDGDLPWPHNSADLKWFKNCTTGMPVIMGRRTWDSLPIKPLPNRDNYVLSRSFPFDAPGAINLEPNPVKQIIELGNKQDIWIIGGAQILNSCVSIIDEFWLSRIKGTYQCDVFLPRTIIEEQYSMYYAQPTDGIYVEKWRKLPSNA